MISWLSFIPLHQWIIPGVYLATFLIACTVIFVERKTSSEKLAWIMVLYLVPLVGIILYLVFSQNISRQKIYRLSEREEDFINDSLQSQILEMKTENYKFLQPVAEKWSDMVKLHQVYGNAFFTQDNKVVSVMTNGNVMLDNLLEDIRNAEHSVNCMFFIVKNDDAGERLIKALTEKAAEGKEVRFLVDAVGGKAIPGRLLKEFTAAGGKYAFFFRPKLRISRWFSLKLNYRNHRKITVIDEKIGYVGGFNIGREYLGQKRKFGNWRDTHIKLKGSCVLDLNARFLTDWRTASGEDVSIDATFFVPVEKAGDTGVQIVSCGPNSQREEVKRGYMKMITSAKKNVYIQSPYFVPDEAIIDSIKMAAQSGVDVRVMIPCMPDHMFVYWATYSYAGEIIRSGGRVFVYDDGFLHAKTMVVDGEVATVGSANFDNRSFRLNFETNAFIYDTDAALELEELFLKDIEESCHELTLSLYNERSVVVRFKEAVAHLMTGIL